MIREKCVFIRISSLIHKKYTTKECNNNTHGYTIVPFANNSWNIWYSIVLNFVGNIFGILAQFMTRDTFIMLLLNFIAHYYFLSFYASIRCAFVDLNWFHIKLCIHCADILEKRVRLVTERLMIINWTACTVLLFYCIQFYGFCFPPSFVVRIYMNDGEWYGIPLSNTQNGHHRRKTKKN